MAQLLTGNLSLQVPQNPKAERSPARPLGVDMVLGDVESSVRKPVANSLWEHSWLL